MDAKEALGRYAASLIEDGMVVGLGTGTTSEAFLIVLGERVRREGLTIKGVPTSNRTEIRARELNIPITFMGEIDIAVDGADEVDRNKNLIKGGGGAMLREKIVDYAAKKFLCIVEERKLVRKLGRAIPCEVHPLAHNAMKALSKYGKPSLRMSKETPFITDNGNFIIDLESEIENPKEMEMLLNAIPGVLENGIFTCPCNVIAADEEGSISEF
jgi:ribose 5-phosphate isomerase A